ncbi:hypothetical protein JH06_2924 [Blastocystis sp. subtype 4]|uniref:hypothetical protein n=1 Tax=Blastocystis sp. subtype 4 TaxID=944170 RepID=UPI000711FF4D|nr:hypothetical protein JH06_2924 [Blastocystis sp. subtype 4]KNB43249.1 hypothetical protein JH06_2924 [Blastocystis sp. subtype 4]|eukprot:XP_014526692.1 hypothetical protein JH06_2924 [Blastocystis sp. subtype 4]
MEEEVAVSNSNESEVDISSLDYLVNKTWRVYAISPILSTVNEQSFINSLVPSLRQEYEKYSGPLNNVKLLRVLVHEIEAIQGFDYCVGYNLSFTDKDRAISLYCCIFAQYPRSTHVSHSMLLIKGKKELRKVFLNWFKKAYDVFINLSRYRFSSYQLQHLCETAFSRSLNRVNENMVLSFSVPSVVDGMSHIHISVPVEDVQRLVSAYDHSKKCWEVIQDHFQELVTMDPEVLLLTQIRCANLTATRDGRVKFTEKQCISELVNALSQMLVEYCV